MNPPSACPQPRSPEIWGDFIQTCKQKCHWPDSHPLGILGHLGGREILPALMQQMLNKRFAVVLLNCFDLSGSSLICLLQRKREFK